MPYYNAYVFNSLLQKLLLVIGKLIEAVVAKGGDSVHYGRGFNLVKGGTTAKQ